MAAKRMTTARRTRGTGALFIRTNAAGRRVYYGKWRDTSGNQVMKRLGPERTRGMSDGLTKSQAEAELRRLIQDTLVKPKVVERKTFATAGAEYIGYLENLKNRKPTTVQDYRIILHTHFVEFFGDRPLDSITAADVDRYVSTKRAERGADRKARRAAGHLSAKTVNNHLNFMSSLFRYATNERRRWATVNPVVGAERPAPDKKSDKIHFLSVEELHASIRAVPGDGLGETDRALYLTAALTGLRQGELVALQWQDVDWTAEAIRVRLNYTRGAQGTPKSGRERSVPMAPQVAGALDRLLRAQGWANDHEARCGLVFPHPATGSFYDASKMRKRFDTAIATAGVPRITFHELRHTFGTTMAAKGIDVRRLQEWMGHADLKTTLIYLHHAPRREDAAAIGRAFEVEVPSVEGIGAVLPTVLPN